jgi:hypothetical protein
MSKTRDTGFLGNVVKYDANGNVTVVNGATTLLSVSSSGQLTVPGDEVITGSLTVLGGITGAITGSATSASYAANASLLNGSGSGEFVPTGSFNTFSSSILTYTGSVDSRLGSLEITSGSNITRLSSIESTTGSLNTASGSAITRLNALEVTSGSNITRLSALETASGSAITRLNSIESKTGSYATTGSNTFDGGQYFSSSFNPTGFSTTASLYTDGGLRVTKDAYISGTLYLNNVTVFGTQSVNYISSSQLNIGTNIISVNTDTPSIRFGGLSVYDSGSTSLTGSILWDSEDNQWIYSNPSGSTYDSAVFLVGPRNVGVLGNEVGISCNFISKGNGMHHMTSSGIFENGTTTCFYGNSFISSSGVACFASTVCAPQLSLNSSAQQMISAVGSSTGGTVMLLQNTSTGGDCWRIFSTGAGNGEGVGHMLFNNSAGVKMMINSSGFVGIGTTCPSSALDVVGMQTIRDVSTTTTYITTNATSDVPRFELYNSGSGTMTMAYRGASAPGTQNMGELRVQANSPLVFSTNNIERTRITNTGITCFACQICSPGAVFTGTARFSGGNNADVNNVAIRIDNQKSLSFYNCGETGWAFTMGTDQLNNGLIGTSNSLNFATSPTLNTRLTITNTGIACFACQVCAPAFVGGTLNGTSATITTAGTACTVTDVLTLANSQSGGSSVCAGAGILFTGNLGGTAARIYSRGNMNFNNGSDLVFQTQVSAGGTPQCTMVINGASQSVGIGTFNPGQTLAVNGNSYFGCLTNTLNFSTGGCARFLEVGAGSGGDALLVTHASGYGVGYFGYDASNDRLVIATDCGGGANNIDFILNAGTCTGGSGDNLNVSPAMRITAGGNVGIGTCTPGTVLVIRSGVTNSVASPESQVTITNTTSGNFATFGFRSVDSDGDHGRAGITVSKDAGTITGKMHFVVRADAGTFSNPMTILSGGNVGINTPNPTRMLHVCGGGAILRVGPDFPAMSAGTDRDYIDLIADGSITKIISPNEQFLISNPGGGAGSYCIVMVAGSGGVVLTNGATSWGGASDLRLKNINSEITNATSKLNTLRAVNFSWKSDETQKENLGLIAQDVVKVFPEVVNYNPSIDEYSLRYTELIPVLVKAIQEQTCTICSLKICLGIA